ncbi:uncharacterized protein LOC131030188 [Cryptomeria japonica]|uniref:uncharacterized protein LOC131030188 n=1 Tax=Cryptomeria japonica TaxID=3369 RepID=UPI0027D9D496|nr:uncharacterized protein LOC131030188 [Cryptomeria japonica]XP_057816884.2 uncharacterized protein LOC131030188 [Cryptomeria japonica]XP_057816885.2 uncharacterized protein LOC131030188 [Cryptomeria japonica]
MTPPPATATASNIFSHFPVEVSSQNRNGFQKTAHIDVGEDDVKIKNEGKPRTEISLANFSSEDPVKQGKGKSSEQPKSLRSRLIKLFKSPTRGENYNIPQALMSVDMIILFVAITCGVGTTINAIDNMGQIEKAQGYTPVNISTVFSLINIWNFLGRVAAGLFSEFLYEKYKFPRPLIFTIVLLIACLQHVFTAFPLPGSPYVASTVISLYFRTRWPKSFRSCLVSGLHFTNRKWRERANKGEGLKHLPCCGYMEVKEASLLAQRRLFAVFISFLIMSPAEGIFMPRIYSETQSAQTISDSDINQYAPAVHSERTAATMDMVPRPRKLSEPSKPKLDRGSGA